jgi:hypothetical protein
MRQYYELWMLNKDRMEFTEAGNPRPPSPEVYLDWISNAWWEDGLSNEVIEKSFKG